MSIRRYRMFLPWTWLVLFAACQPVFTDPCPADGKPKAGTQGGDGEQADATKKKPNKKLEPKHPVALQGPPPSFTVECPKKVQFDDDDLNQGYIPEGWAEWRTASRPAAEFEQVIVRFLNKHQRWRIICVYKHPARADLVRIQKLNQHSPTSSSSALANPRA